MKKGNLMEINKISRDNQLLFWIFLHNIEQL